MVGYKYLERQLVRSIVGCGEADVFMSTDELNDTGLRPHINFCCHHLPMCMKVFSSSRHHHDSVMNHPSRNGVVNEYMLVIGHLVGLSMVELYADGEEIYWGLNRYGHMLAMQGHLLNEVMIKDFLTRFPFSFEEMMEVKKRDQKKLQDHREIFDKIAKEAMGFRPEALDSLGERKIVLETIAVSMSMSAVDFNGYSFSPTLWGAWLSVSPESPLNLISA